MGLMVVLAVDVCGICRSREPWLRSAGLWNGRHCVYEGVALFWRGSRRFRRRRRRRRVSLRQRPHAHEGLVVLRKRLARRDERRSGGVRASCEARRLRRNPLRFVRRFLGSGSSRTRQLQLHRESLDVRFAWQRPAAQSPFRQGARQQMAARGLRRRRPRRHRDRRWLLERLRLA